MINRFKLKYQLYFLVSLTLFLFFLFALLNNISFSRIIYDRAEDTAEQMIEQVAQNVTNMANSVESSAAGLLYYNTLVQELMTSDDRVKNLERYETLSQLVNAVKKANRNIYSVTWISDDLHMLSDPGRDDNAIVTQLLSQVDFASKDFRQPVFTSVIQGPGERANYFGYIFPVYSRQAKGLPKIGCGVIVLNIFELENLVKINNITENSLFIILDQNNNVVVSNRELQTGEPYQNVFWQEDAQGIVKTTVDHNGMESLAQYMPIEEIGWKIVSIIPTQELSSDMDRVMQIGIILALLSSLLLIFGGHLIITNITKPINSIVDFLRRTQTDTLNKRVEIPQQNEIAIIASNINTMLDRVETMTNKMVEHQAQLYEAKLAEQDAELVALQSQINPHFLYNTLNCISNIGLAYDIPEVSDISVAMSNIYRYSIKGDNIVSLSAELQCIKEYMRIMDIRFNGKFEAEYKFDDDVLELYTLRMILQPIVENAVYHGMEQRSGKGKLLIEGRILENDQLILTVQDDGKGMSPEQLETLRRTITDYEDAGLYNAAKSSIGLSNINKRIKLQFGKQYGMYVESLEAVGTQVTLVLPVIRDRREYLNNAMDKPSPPVN